MKTAEVFSLDLPPEAFHLGTARVFASKVARHFGCEDDAALDLQLAVSEACTESISAAPDVMGGIRVQATHDGERVRFEIRGAGSFDGSSGESFSVEGAARLELIRTLFPDAAVAPLEPGAFVLTFSVPTAT